MELPPETCRAVYRNIINCIYSHLVGQLLTLIHEARTQEHKMREYYVNPFGPYTPFTLDESSAMNIQNVKRKFALTPFPLDESSAMHIQSVKCKFALTGEFTFYTLDVHRG